MGGDPGGGSDALAKGHRPVSLRAIISAQIRALGPMPVSEYMALCLGHPEHGYYMTRDPIGRSGDFITAPETSQMFGELVGLALAQSWLDQGCPSPFALVELGPGRGTLMADLLRATARVPGFREAARLCLVETSPALRRVQADTLRQAEPVWVDQLDAVADLPLFLVANEFFDALPIRQHLRTENGWCERRVGLSDDTLVWGLVPVQPLGLNTAIGAVIEHSPAVETIAETIGRRLASRGGAALVIDYGDWEGLGDTLQALAAHQPVGVLDTPGAADLTAHVQFGALAAAAVEAGAQLSGFAEQGAWLESLGLAARSDALSSAVPERRAEIAAQHRRLTEPGPKGMGQLFKVLGLTGPDAPAMPGFPPPEGTR